MAWDVEYTDEFQAWWDTLNEKEQEAVDVKVTLLEAVGPHLGSPHSSQIKSSRHSHMRELRIQCSGHPYRILYAFDPRRVALLLLGGSKVGRDDWYEKNVPTADKLYDTYLTELEEEDLL